MANLRDETCQLEAGKNASERMIESTCSTNRRRKFEWEKWLKYVSLVVLVVQNAGQVLIMRYAQTRPQEQFLKTVAVFFNEIIKLCASMVLFTISTGSLKSSLHALRYHFLTNVCDTFKVGVPAFIYVIQNMLLYVAVENLEAATYMVTYQLKILTTAGFTVLMLHRKLSPFQWASLIILIAGVALVQYNAKSAKVSPTPTPIAADNITESSALSADLNSGNPFIGLIAVLVACVLSGFAGIYFEKILKKSNVSVWMRNIQLAALSIPISACVIAVKDHEAVYEKGVMQGFDNIVWVLVLIQALGGLIVAVVIKYADNILKAFATSIAIIVGTIASIYFFSIWPQPLFILGAMLVIVAVVVYGMFPYKPKQLVSETQLELRKENNEQNP